MEAHSDGGRSTGTVDGTVTLHFQETRDCLHRVVPKRFSPNPFGDVSKKRWSRFVQLVYRDAHTNNAGKATLKAVSISLTDKPQLCERRDFGSYCA